MVFELPPSSGQAFNYVTVQTSREREQTLTLEGVELERIRDDLKKKIEQIEKDFFDALVPVIGRIQVSPLYVQNIPILTLRLAR